MTQDYISQGFEVGLPTDSREILSNFSFPEEGGLICTNEEALNKQKGVLGAVLKQVLKNAL